MGRAIRRVRAEQKINQEESAERCGLHRTYYSDVERGVRNVSLVNIEKITKGLKRSLPELFGRIWDPVIIEPTLSGGQLTRRVMRPSGRLAWRGAPADSMPEMLK